MTTRLSRRKLAQYTAERLIEGDQSVIDELSSLIVAERREREVDLLVRDIEDQLGLRGVTIATVETASPLSDTARQSVIEMVGGDVRIREVVKPELIGGVRVVTSSREFDGTIAGKLYALRSKKV